MINKEPPGMWFSPTEDIDNRDTRLSTDMSAHQGCRIPSTTVHQYVDLPAQGCRVSTQGCQIRSTVVDTHVQSSTQGCRVPAQGCWVPTNSSNQTSGPFHHPQATSTPKFTPPADPGLPDFMGFGKRY